jgi:mannose-6-phosphate isomerase-like protein (cupin superfamily)
VVSVAGRERAPHVGRERRGPAVGVDPHDRVPAADAGLALAADLPRVRDRGRPDPRRRQVDLELVLEAQDRQVLGLDAPAWVVGPVVEEAERAQQSGLRPLGPAKRGREVDPAARVRVDPGDAGALDVSRARDAASVRVVSGFPRMSAADVSTTTIDLAADERFVSLRRALGVESFGINQLTLQPGQRGRIHRHGGQEEVYVVVQGTLTLVVEGDELELGEGGLARVPASVRRQLVNRGATPLVLVAIGAAGEHVGRDGEAFEDWSETDGRPPQEVPLPFDVPHA